MIEETKEKSEWQNREMGAFWTKEGPKGKYLTGNIEVDELGIKKKVKVVVFPNRHKTNEKAPDYVIYKSEPLSGEPSKPKEDKEQLPEI